MRSKCVPAVLLLALVAVTLPPARSRAQGRLGGEFQVNTQTTGDQSYPVVASDSTGNLTVAWNGSLQDGSAVGVFGRRYASSGASLGGEFQINSFTTGNQSCYRGVASDQAGNFVVVWVSAQSGYTYGVLGQRYASSGGRLGEEFAVSTYTSENQFGPVVAAGPAGDFVIVWHAASRDGAGYGVVAQRFAGTGERLGSEFLVNSYTSDDQAYPTVAASPQGGFVVVWESTGPDGSGIGLFGQRYSSVGATLGSEFRVNSYTTGAQNLPNVAFDSTGSFVVVWKSGQNGSGDDVFGQRFASSGAPLGGEFQVNDYTPSTQTLPAVAFGPGGGFVVAWQSSGPDGSGFGIAGRSFSPAGAPIGPEFQVNSQTTNAQTAPSIAFASADGFVVVWMGSGQDGSANGVFGQRFCLSSLTAVSVSVVGSLDVCPATTGGTATVTDTGGVGNVHQWYYRTSPMGASTPIPGETGTSYLVKGADFAGGATGTYYLYCQTTPSSCGLPMFSTETIAVTVDVQLPTVTPPPSAAFAQTLCQ